ncbi:MAG: HD domain-containing protein [Candidatus Eremiobacteraeota bacterium]|nr:HD domain-containing protein [Candidatus Eremiobacteraeota bacterium]
MKRKSLSSLFKGPAGESWKRAADFFLLSWATSLIIAFFVSYSLFSLVRVPVILTAGAFVGACLALIIYLSDRLISRFRRDVVKRTLVHLVVFPAGSTLAGVMAELFVFRLGGAHFTWVLGITISTVAIGLFLEGHARVQDLIRNSMELLEREYRQIVISLNSSLDVIEPYNRGHSERVAWYALGTAKRMGLDDDLQRTIARAALLHDIGKIGISEKILLKEEPLTGEEWKVLKSHPDIAKKILKPLREFTTIIKLIQFHHERSDGKGYKKVPGDKVPLGSRIIIAAEAFDSMTTDTPFRKARTAEEALQELVDLSGSQFDGEVVKHLSGLIGDPGSFTLPTPGEIRSMIEPEGFLDRQERDFDAAFEITGTAKRIGTMRRFYLLFGQERHQALSALLYALAAGLLLGLLVGFSIFALRGEPMRIVSSLCQGLFIGFVIFLVSPLAEKILAFLRKGHSPFWESPAAASLAYFPAGIIGGAFSLYLIIFTLYPHEPTSLTQWNMLYITAVGFVASVMAYFLDRTRRAARLLLLSLRKLQAFHLELIYSLAFALEAKDPYTKGHTERVAKYCRLVGDACGLDEKGKEDLRLAAFFHDIGKIGVRLSVLHKSAKLDEDEFEAIKGHPATGAELLECIEAFSHIAPYVRHHHEQWDGRGYPDGLKGEEIPLISRIISVADVYDALVTDRPYKEGFTWEKSIAILKEGSGTLFDPGVVTAFIGELERLDPSVIEEVGLYSEVENLDLSPRGEE